MMTKMDNGPREERIEANVERYLRECLDSVVNQTLKDIEIICVNDGSTDGSPSILKDYASQDDRIVVINKKS